jgi:hypothetical protein
MDISVGVYFRPVSAEPLHLLEDQLLGYQVFEDTIDIIGRKFPMFSIHFKLFFVDGIHFGMTAKFFEDFEHKTVLVFEPT